MRLLKGLAFCVALAAGAFVPSAFAAETEVILGNPTAAVTVIEYASLTCPHCADFHVGTFPELKTEYVDTGKVKWVLRHYPLDALAVAAALLVQCAPEEKRFQLASMIFQGQNIWVQAPRPIIPLKQYANLVGVSGAQADACIRDRAMIEALRDARTKAAKEYDVQATPAFYVGNESIQGAPDFATLSDVIDRALANAE